MVRPPGVVSVSLTQKESNPLMIAMPQTTITDEQMRQFREDGFVLIENALAPYGLSRAGLARHGAERRL
jgi:hypothetical protein